MRLLPPPAKVKQELPPAAKANREHPPAARVKRRSRKANRRPKAPSLPLPIDENHAGDGRRFVSGGQFDCGGGTADVAEPFGAIFRAGPAFERAAAGAF